MPKYNLLFTATSAQDGVETIIICLNKIKSIFLSKTFEMAILKIKDVVVNVQSVISDGPITNFSALNYLGCRFSENPHFNLNVVSYEIIWVLFGSFTCSNCVVMFLQIL